MAPKKNFFSPFIQQYLLYSNIQLIQLVLKITQLFIRNNSNLLYIIQNLMNSFSFNLQTKIFPKIEQDRRDTTPYATQTEDKGSQDQQNLTGKWSDEENIKFTIFITSTKDIFKSKEKRKAERIFKNLATFVGSRSARQCRSHFQKSIKRFSTIAKMKNFYRELIGQKEFQQRMEDSRCQIEQINSQLKSKQVKSVKLVDVEIQTENPFGNMEEQFAAMYTMPWIYNQMCWLNLNWQ